jgi:hypothetical protein
MFKLDNNIHVCVRSGKTGQLVYDSQEHNDIADDFRCASGSAFIAALKNTSQPYCFLLPDGGDWSGFTFDPTNPSAPYCINGNDYDHTGAQQDTGADLSYKTKAYLAPPWDPTNNATTGKWKFFFQWTALPVDFTLKAVALTAWQTSFSDFCFGPAASPAIFVPETLAVLPSPITVKGRNATVPSNIATQTPDILQVSYYLSIVGA